MTEEKTLYQEVKEEMTRFKKTIEELRFLRCVSKDLKNYRKMLRLKKYD